MKRKVQLNAIGNWRAGNYLIASWNAPQEQPGRTANGLGMAQLWRGSPKGRRAPGWCLTHLGSGLRVCIIEAHEPEAFVIADRVAELGDWGFDGPEGWRNIDAQLMERFSVLVAQTPKITVAGARSLEDRDRTAREVALARA